MPPPFFILQDLQKHINNKLSEPYLEQNLGNQKKQKVKHESSKIYLLHYISLCKRCKKKIQNDLGQKTFKWTGQTDECPFVPLIKSIFKSILWAKLMFS